MARQKSFATVIAERERAERRIRVAQEKASSEAKKASGTAEAERKNQEHDKQISALNGILSYALLKDVVSELEMMNRFVKVPTPDWTSQLEMAEKSPVSHNYQLPNLTGIQRLLPGAKKRREADLARAREKYKADVLAYKNRETSRQNRLAQAKAEYERRQANYRGQIQLIEKLKADYIAGLPSAIVYHMILTRNLKDFPREQIYKLNMDFTAGLPSAIVDYFTLVLVSSRYPDTFPKQAKVAYLPESKQLVVEYDFPSFEVVPEIGDFKYVTKTNKITSKAVADKQRKTLYASVIAQITLRTLYELFKEDKLGYLDTIVFNGMVDTIDKGTGHPVRPCLITVRTTRDVFDRLDLTKVDPAACLKVLSASVSKSPAELAPVRPVLEFNMVDPRFIEETDVLSTLDSRPNLMELTPSEFESLITNLFEKMGLETRQTQASRDGGVDCVAYNLQPILGGKVVIQAKRYKHTVGVSAVRDLFGTMQNEGASKGILVTTSGFGKASHEFANGKPLELIDGRNLLFLLAENAGIEAKIEAPESWKDPQADSSDEAIYQPTKTT